MLSEQRLSLSSPTLASLLDLSGLAVVSNVLAGYASLIPVYECSISFDCTYDSY